MVRSRAQAESRPLAPRLMTTISGVQLCGIYVDDDDLKTLVDLLLRVGRAEDLSAAAAIEGGLQAGADGIDLTPAGCTAVLGVLDSPAGNLVPLRDHLASIHRERFG